MYIYVTVGFDNFHNGLSYVNHFENSRISRLLSVSHFIKLDFCMYNAIRNIWTSGTWDQKGHNDCLETIPEHLEIEILEIHNARIFLVESAVSFAIQALTRIWILNV